ncbi:unnamed protein product, partial [Pylaiella littoralis]
KNLTRDEKDEVIRHLLAGSSNGILGHGAYKEAAATFGCCWKTISRLWKRYELQRQAGVTTPNLNSGREGNSGLKGHNLEELREKLADTPLNDRTTMRRLAEALGISLCTLARNLNALGLRAHSNALKPYLTDDGKLERLRWVLRWVRVGGYATRAVHDFDDFVHVDEKMVLPFQGGPEDLLVRWRDPPGS